MLSLFDFFVTNIETKMVGKSCTFNVIRPSRNISGLVNVTVTSPAGIMNFSLNIEPRVKMERGYAITYLGQVQKKPPVNCSHHLCPLLAEFSPYAAGGPFGHNKRMQKNLKND